VRTLEWQQKKLDLILTYSRFLHSRKRIDEASSVLLFAWKEFEHSEFSMYESIVRLLRDVAVVLKAVKLNTVALSVYQKCFTYYKNVSETTVVTEIEEQITSTSMEIIGSATSTVSETTEITVREVSCPFDTKVLDLLLILFEVFELNVASSTTLTQHTIELVRNLPPLRCHQANSNRRNL
jgi:hypothetical protein